MVNSWGHISHLGLVIQSPMTLVKFHKRSESDVSPKENSEMDQHVCLV